MKLSKHITATVLISTMFASINVNAQTTVNDNSSGLQQIVSSLVSNALQNATNEIDSQLESIKESANELFFNSTSENLDAQSNDANSSSLREDIQTDYANEIIIEVNQTNSAND